MSVEARELWQTLLRADALLARAAQLPRVGHAPAPAAPAPAPPAPAPAKAPTPAAPAFSSTEPFVAASPEVGSYPAAPPPAAPAAHRPWPVGTILLVLGAFSLIVAGLIFVTRSWDSIGLAGKATILLGVTAVMGGLGVWVTGRRLRASAEAVWSVFLALLTLDVFAARHEGLVGLDALALDWTSVVWGVVALGSSVAIALWARPRVSVELIAPAIAGGLAIALAGIGAGAVGNDLDFAWRAFVALVVAGVLALATRPAGLAHLTLVARIVVAGFFAAAYLAAAVELLFRPELDVLVDGAHGLPMVLMGLAALVIGWVVPVVRVPAVALAVVAASLLVVVPASDAGGDDATWAAVAVLAAVLAAAGTRGDNGWVRGVRLGAAPAIAGVVGLHAALLAEALETMGRLLDDPWRTGWDVRLDVVPADDRAVWTVLVVVAALIVVTAVLPSWPELAFARPHTPLVLGAAVALAVLNGVIAVRLPLWAVAAVLLGVAVAMLVVHLRGVVSSLVAVATALVVAASVLAAGSQGASTATWIVGGVVLAALAYAEGVAWLRQLCSGLSVALLLGGTAALFDLTVDESAVTVLAVVVVALAILAAAGLALAAHPVRVPVEVVAAVGALVALVAGGSSSEIALRWTLAGVALIALGFVVDSRRWYVWPGIASLVVAYVALILDSGFSFVEAYTLPLGAAAVAAGLYFLRSKPDASTWMYLGPGLALALLPSVPQALVEPTELRALVLGVAALVVLAVGVRLGWQAPFATGATILALLVLFNIGPYANAAPRVVLIAAAGAVMLGLGISWEDRVRDGRKIVGYVRSMR